MDQEMQMDEAFFKCRFCGAEAPKGKHVCGDRYSDEEMARRQPDYNGKPGTPTPSGSVE